MTNSNNPPVDRIKEGNLEIAIWANQTEKGTRYTTDGVVRSYTDAQGNWKKTRSLSNGEILRAARLLNLAYTRIGTLKVTEKETTTA